MFIAGLGFVQTHIFPVRRFWVNLRAPLKDSHWQVNHKLRLLCFHSLLQWSRCSYFYELLLFVLGSCRSQAIFNDHEFCIYAAIMDCVYILLRLYKWYKALHFSILEIIPIIICIASLTGQRCSDTYNECVQIF